MLPQQPSKQTATPPHRHSGISAARRACLPTEAPGEFFHTLSCGRPAQRIKPSPQSAGGGILLRLDWEPLRERRLTVARGRSWQPEIGMEHASRGRRSGNKGVGARWRGRFRIFSARHCSRTKVSHAENSGMTMLFFSWGLLRCRACVDHRRVDSCEGEVVAARDWHGACLPGSAFWK